VLKIRKHLANAPFIDDGVVVGEQHEAPAC
jgi:hypothetical protein